MDGMTMWTGPALAGMLIALLGIALWSLAHESVDMSRANEESIPAICSEVRARSADAEVRTNVIDARAAEDGRRIQGGALASAAVHPPGKAQPLAPVEAGIEAGGQTEGVGRTCDESGDASVDVSREVQRLAALATPEEEIACRLGIAPGEVRLLIAMHTARASRRGAVGRSEVPDSPGEVGERVAGKHHEG